MEKLTEMTKVSISSFPVHIQRRQLPRYLRTRSAIKLCATVKTGQSALELAGFRTGQSVFVADFQKHNFGLIS
jgi:hypothetical protein